MSDDVIYNIGVIYLYVPIQDKRAPLIVFQWD